MGQLLGDDIPAVVCSTSVRMGETKQRRAERSRLAVHDHVTEFGLGNPMGKAHPLHEVNRQLAVLPDEDLKIALLQDADGAVFHGGCAEGLARVVKGIDLSEHVSRLMHIQDEFLALVG
ncbi:hypothetical protein D3C73_1370910 [compost metagenome]